MIIREFFMTRPDGISLYRTYSDSGVMVRQIETGVEYSEAVDVENTPYTYEETDTPVEDDFEPSEPVIPGTIPAQEALDIIMGEG